MMMLLIWAVGNITANWNFNGIRKLRVSAAASGLLDPDNGYYIEDFASTSNDWSKALARMRMAVNIFNAGDVTPPTRVRSQQKPIVYSARKSSSKFPNFAAESLSEYLIIVATAGSSLPEDSSERYRDSACA
uniref:Uncharacterized protein n=1 Tax=Parascaris univalens TaxID=6257 RepID=A0A915CGB4_PARUN